MNFVFQIRITASEAAAKIQDDKFKKFAGDDSLISNHKIWIKFKLNYIE